MNVDVGKYREEDTGDGRMKEESKGKALREVE